MGWHNLNTTQEHRKFVRSCTIDNAAHGRKRRLAASELDLHTINLAELPVELVHKIFIYSGNLHLAFVSKRIQQLLSPCFQLHRGLVLESMSPQGLRAKALLWPFVDAALLKRLDIKKFQAIPYQLETSSSLRAAGLLEYMLECGTTIYETKVFDLFVEHKLVHGIKLLLEKLEPTAENLNLAIERGVSAVEMLSHAEELDMDLLWNCAQAHKRTDVLDYLRTRLA